MPPISESNRYTTADLKLSQCTDKKEKVKNSGSTDHATTTKKPAHNTDEIASLKTTKDGQEKQVKSASELNKNRLKGFEFDDCIEKLNEVIKNVCPYILLSLHKLITVLIVGIYSKTA